MKCDEGDGYNNVCSVLGLTSYYYWELDRHWKLKRLKAENDIDFLGTQDSTFPLSIYVILIFILQNFHPLQNSNFWKLVKGQKHTEN
jgi:hypothetical protein